MLAALGHRLLFVFAVAAGTLGGNGWFEQSNASAQSTKDWNQVRSPLPAAPGPFLKVLSRDRFNPRRDVDEPMDAKTQQAFLTTGVLEQLRSDDASEQFARYLHPDNEVTPAEAAAEVISKPRLWTDTTGKFKVMVTFESATPESVRLKKPDGSTIEVPLSRPHRRDRSNNWRSKDSVVPFFDL